MVTELKQKTPHTIKIEFSDENVTAFGGLVLAERLAARLGLWRKAAAALPKRDGLYDWLTILKSVVAGLLSGAQGTYAVEEVREDASLLSLLGLEGAPEEATIWRVQKELGALQKSGRLPNLQCDWVRQILRHARRQDLLFHGFFPVFGDGTLLEGSARREGTKVIPDKGVGILWSTVFAGPLVAAQQVAAPGEGEETCVRRMLEPVLANVLRPLRFHKNALLLLDSLHGDGVTLDEAERLGFLYVVGANKLTLTAMTLAQQPEFVWQDTGANAARGWSESGVCVCWIQCEGWKTKRTLVGRRFKRAGQFIWEYAGVMTNLAEADVRHVMRDERNYAEAIWSLYNGKAGMEDRYKDLLSDLGLHHPPCREHVRNAGFYAVASLAHTLGVAVNLIGGKSAERGSREGKNGGNLRRAKPRRMRLWRLRRRLFALPGRVASHARELTVTLLGLSERLREEFERFFLNACRC
jgi:hypothetical protein